MKRLRGACKGCKCIVPPPEGQTEYQCKVRYGRFKKPPKTCEKRIDAATYLEETGAET